MIKFFVEYSIGEIEQKSGNLFTSLSTDRINLFTLEEILGKIADKEDCPRSSVFVENIAKINTN